MPVGIINERHEPPVFYGVERPFVDTVIVPTTWFDVGAGVHGRLGRGFAIGYVMAPLDATEFSADEGLARRHAEGQRGERSQRRADRPRRIHARARPDASAPAAGAATQGSICRASIPRSASSNSTRRYRRRRLRSRAASSRASSSATPRG